MYDYIEINRTELKDGSVLEVWTNRTTGKVEFEYLYPAEQEEGEG